MNIFISQRPITTRLVAGVAIAALLLSVLPASFYVSEAFSGDSKSGVNDDEVVVDTVDSQTQTDDLVHSGDLVIDGGSVTGSTTGSTTVLELNTDESAGGDTETTVPVTISIKLCKYGYNDEDEESYPVSGWKIFLFNFEVPFGDEAIAALDPETDQIFELFTGEDGCVTQTVDPVKGPWRAYEDIKDGWYQDSVSVDGGEIVDEDSQPLSCIFSDYISDSLSKRRAVFDEGFRCDFYNVGNFQEVTGYKWNDENNNGIKDASEAGLANWTITATADSKSEYESLSTTTDGTGFYSMLLPWGAQWTIAEELQPNWTQTNLILNGESVNATSSDEVYDVCVFGLYYAKDAKMSDRKTGVTCDFLNHYTAPVIPTTAITGYKWNDANNNGLKDEGETGIANWTITASDLSEESSGSVSTTTDASGAYTLLVPVGTWRVTEEIRPNWTQTAVFKNSTTTNSEGSPLTSCVYYSGLMSKERSKMMLGSFVGSFESSQRCDFLNHYTEPVVTETPRRSGGGSSGTKVRDRATPTGTVLGASTSTPQCGMYLNDYMRQGKAASSTEVTKLQIFINAVGIKLPVTGIFDAATDAGVKQFQAMHKAEVLTPWYAAKIVPHENPTGWVYQLTRWKINNLVCPGSEAYPVLN